MLLRHEFTDRHRYGVRLEGVVDDDRLVFAIGGLEFVAGPPEGWGGSDCPFFEVRHSARPIEFDLADIAERAGRAVEQGADNTGAVVFKIAPEVGLRQPALGGN